MQGILPFVVRRLLWAPFILLAVSLVTFALGRFGPGDPILIVAGQHNDPETIERIRQHKGLDKPFLEQYSRYLWNLFHGDLGESLKYPGRTVGEIVFPKMWVSAQLGLVALFLTFAVGIPVGIVAALRQGTWLDPFIISLFLFFQSVPVIVMIPILLLIFVLKLEWFPASGWDGIFSQRVVLPVVVLSLPGTAGVARLMRTSTLQVLDEDYVRTARAKGLAEFVIISRHVARNALLPLVTVVGFALVTILEGAFFTETLFGIPGIGRTAVDAVFNRDYDVIMALTLILGAAFIVANIVIDITYTFIDPRIRYGGRAGA